MGTADGAAGAFEGGIDQFVGEFRKRRWRRIVGVCGMVHARRMFPFAPRNAP
jgi:hypothetical protein